MAFFILVITIESGLSIYSYSKQKVSTSFIVLNQYRQAKKEDENLKKQIGIMQVAETEDNNLVEMIDKLAQVKPDTIQFTSLILDDTGITIAGIGEDPTTFGNYVKAINDQKPFCNTKLERMVSTDIGNSKTFTIKTSISK